MNTIQGLHYDITDAGSSMTATQRKLELNMEASLSYAYASTPDDQLRMQRERTTMYCNMSPEARASQAEWLTQELAGFGDRLYTMGRNWSDQLAELRILKAMRNIQASRIPENTHNQWVETKTGTSTVWMISNTAYQLVMLFTETDDDDYRFNLTVELFYQSYHTGGRLYPVSAPKYYHFETLAGRLRKAESEKQRLRIFFQEQSPVVPVRAETTADGFPYPFLEYTPMIQEYDETGVMTRQGVCFNWSMVQVTSKSAIMHFKLPQLLLNAEADRDKLLAYAEQVPCVHMTDIYDSERKLEGIEQNIRSVMAEWADLQGEQYILENAEALLRIQPPVESTQNIWELNRDTWVISNNVFSATISVEPWNEKFREVLCVQVADIRNFSGAGQTVYIKKQVCKNAETTKKHVERTKKTVQKKYFTELTPKIPGDMTDCFLQDGNRIPWLEYEGA